MALCKPLARNQRAGTDLTLLAPRVELRGSESMCAARRVVVFEDSVAAQNMGNDVVGEDRQAVEVVELRHAGERQVGGE